MAEQDPEVKMIRLATIDKMDTVAVIGALPVSYTHLDVYKRQSQV